MPLTPPLKPIELRPFSLTFRLMSTCGSVDIELTVFVDADVQIADLLRIVIIEDRDGREVDIAAAPIKLLQVLEALSKLCIVVNLTGNLPQYSLDDILVEFLGTGNLYIANSVLIVLFNFDRDVVAINGLFPERHWDAPRERRSNKR